jgi:uncharacterized protein YlxP (DUF503 family)
MARISLMLADAHSLKDKRMVIRRIKDRVRERIGVFVSEVGTSAIKDSWQRAELGVAVASSDRVKALALIDDVIRVAMSAGGAVISGVAKDAVTFDGESSPFDERTESVGWGSAGSAGGVVDTERTGSGDKAVGGDDWIPDAWREEPES